MRFIVNFYDIIDLDSISFIVKFYDIIDLDRDMSDVKRWSVLSVYWTAKYSQERQLLFEHHWGPGRARCSSSSAFAIAHVKFIVF